jgi:hypothetical protein
MAKFDNSIGINYLSSGDNISELFNDVGYITLNEVPPPTLQTVLETGNTGIDGTYTLTVDPSFIDILNDPIGNGTDIAFSSFNTSYIQIGNFNNVNNIGKRTSLIKDGLTYATNNSNPSSSIINVTFQTPSTPGSNKTVEFKDQAGVVALLSDIPSSGFLPAGGTAGQILTKVDATDYNATWQENFADWTSVVKHTVKNNGLSGTITKGTAVYVTGSNGTNMLVGRASNASEATSSKTMGLMQSDITTTGGNQTGFVITEGLIQGLNTAGQTAGDPVWLGVNGALIYGLTNKPYAPAHLVFIGIVTKVSAGNGEIFVKVQNGFELREIHDVDLISTTPINGHLLGFDGTLWVNKTIAGWLGFTPVTNARTISTTAPLSGGGDMQANRTLSISQANASTPGFVSAADWNTFNNKFTLPSLTSGSVLFSNGTTIAQSNAQLFWDNTNNYLGIGTNAPTAALDVNGTVKALALQTTDLIANSPTQIILVKNSSGTISARLFSDGSIFRISSSGQFNALSVFANGNLGVNQTTDAGFKLDVNGTARVKGASNLGTTTAFTITNSDSVNVLQVQDNGYIRIGSQATSAFRIYATDISGDSEPSGLNLALNSRVVAQTNAFNLGMVTINGINGTATTGNQNVFLISKGFAPTSGTCVYAASSIIPTINQTGGANGITRGLYINPTLTAAADFRAIEVASGITILGAATTAKASLRIPSGTAPTTPTNGDIWFDGTDLKMRIGGVTKTFTLL